MAKIARKEFFSFLILFENMFKNYLKHSLDNFYIHIDRFPNAIPVRIEDYKNLVVINLNINSTTVEHYFEIKEGIEKFCTEKAYFQEYIKNVPELFEYLDKKDEDYSATYTSRYFGRGGILCAKRCTFMMKDQLVEDLSSFIMMNKIEKVFGSEKTHTEQKKKERIRAFNKTYLTRSKNNSKKDVLNHDGTLPQHLTIYLDSSGSMDIGDLILGISIINRFKELYPKAHIIYKLFSTHVQEVQGYDVNNTLGLLQGGTELSPVVTDMLKNKTHGINILISDMCFNSFSSAAYLPDNVVYISTHDKDSSKQLFKELGAPEELCFTTPTEM